MPEEVARLRLPLLVRSLGLMVEWLEDVYGEDLRMAQDDEWLVITRG